MNGDNMRHVDSFGVEHIPKEIKATTILKQICT